jgi:hypothetical protein
MKKTFSITFLLLVFVYAPHVFAADGFVALAPITGLTDSGVANSNNLAVFFNNLYKFLIGIAAAIAVIEIIYGGLEISTKDSVSKQSDGRARIQQAILGLVLVLSPVLVFSIINPSILNLSLNLDKLDTASGPVTNPSSSSGPTTTTSNGVTQTVSGKYLKTASFVSANIENAKKAVTDWVAKCDVGGQVVWSAALTPPTDTCPGGYTSGVCAQAAPFQAQCAFLAGPYTFVNVNTGWLNGVTSPKLKSIDGSGTLFMNQCISDKGDPYVSRSTLKKLSSCPSGSFTVPSGAPNAAKGGECYESYVVCLPLVAPIATLTDSGNLTK